MDQNIPIKTQKLGKSIRTFGIIGLIIPFIRFFFRIIVNFYILTYYSQEDLISYLEGFILQNRAYYIADLLFFATLAFFIGLFVSHLFRFASLPIPNTSSFKSSAILFLIALIGNGLLCIFNGVYVESTFRQLLSYITFGGDIDSIISRLEFTDLLFIFLFCIPSLLYLIGYCIFIKSDAVFKQIFPNSPYSSRSPYIVVIIGAAIALVADILQIPGYEYETIMFLAMLVSFVGYLTLNIGLIILGSRFVKLNPAFQGYSPYPSSIIPPHQQFQPQSQPYLSYSFPSNPSSPPPNSPTTVMPPSSGISSPTTLFCSHCGKKIPADSTFCMHCGNPLPKIR